MTNNLDAGFRPVTVVGGTLMLSVPSLRRRFLYVVLCTAILLYASPALTQQAESAFGSQQQQAEDFEKVRRNALGLRDESARVSTPPQAAMALDAPIDADSYILGPGDVLGINLRGGIGIYVTAEITPEGTLIVPQFPMLEMDGLSLTAAREVIAERWSAELDDIPLDISLLSMRQMRVSIGGAVALPGQYVVTPADRALTLITLAGGTIEDASDRHAVLVHADGRRENVDQLRYLRFGNRDANPHLTAGAHLIVSPKLGLNEVSVIEVGGGVVIPGTYEWVEGDHLREAIELAGGLGTSATGDEVLLTHFTDGQPITQVVSLASLGESRGPQLQPGDLVYVSMKATRSLSRATVIVRGEVERPGQYPIVAYETRLLDVLELAGGVTDQASLGGSRIWHVRSDENTMAQEVERLDSLHYMLISRSEINMIRDFRRTLQRDFIPVNFVSLFGDDEEEIAQNDIVLFDSLVINVPKKVYHVLVIGAVEQPGYYDFEEDWKYKDYIKLAGGYLKEADKQNVRLMPFESSQFILARNNLKMQSGDIIYIPEKWLPTFWSTFRMYLGIFLQTATLAILIITNT